MTSRFMLIFAAISGISGFILWLWALLARMC